MSQAFQVSTPGERLRQRKVLAGVCLASAAMPMTFTGPAVALRDIAQALGGSPVALAWVTNAFMLAFGSCLDFEFYPAAHCVFKGVSRDFRDRRRKTRLVLARKPEKNGELAHALARVDDVLFTSQFEREKLHERLFATRTVRSSVPRL